MGIKFAEEILDGMVDESGRCGDRGLSEKQFMCLAHYLEEQELEPCGGWSGAYKFIPFTYQEFKGNIGKYHVVLGDYHHFHHRYSVVRIELRPQEEVEREAMLKELGKFERSEWVAEPKKRLDLELTLVRVNEFERERYGSWRGETETVHIYTLADADGNCFVWKSANWLEQEVVDENGRCDWIPAEPGDKVKMRATVKEHGEWRGIKQTVINRPKVERVEKAA